MVTIKKSENLYILRLDPNEELVSQVQDFCAQNDINSAWVNVLGSTKDVDLAFFDAKLKDYDIKKFKEFLEIMSITGNISLKEGEHFFHAHGVFGRQDMSTIGGHVHRCVVSATAEVAIFTLEGDVNRKFDESSGLHLLANS